MTGYGSALVVRWLHRAIMACHHSCARPGPQFPWGTILINIIGFVRHRASSALRQVAAAFAVRIDVRAFVMAGICGGFTTFSSSVCKHWNSRVTVVSSKLAAT
jgi:fluoride ion exporter CrcB/FEX